MRYVEVFVFVFLALLMLMIPGMAYCCFMPIVLILSVVLALTGGFSAVLVLHIGELLFLRCTAFQATASYVGALTTSAMFLAGIWFGMFSPS